MTTVLRVARRLPLLLVPLIVLAVGGEARAGEALIRYEQASPDPSGLSAQIAPGLAGCAAGCSTLRVPAWVAVPARRQALLQYAAPTGTQIVDAQVRLRVRTRQAGVVAKVQGRYGGRWLDLARVRSEQQATRTVTAGRGASALAVALVAESAVPRTAVRADGENAVTVESVVLRVRDASPPELRVEPEAAGSGWLRGPVCAALGATDVGLGVDRLEYGIGAAVATLQGPEGSRLQPRPTALEGRLCVDTAQLPDGAYGTTAAAIDGTGDGNRTTLAGALVRVDNTPPSVEFTGPVDSAARLPELRLALADGASGLDRVQVAIGGIPVVVTPRADLRFAPPQPLQDGLHLVTWQVADAAGNQAAGQAVFAVRDDVAPAIDDVAPVGPATAEAQLRARVQDPGSGIAVDGVRVAVDGVDMTAAATFADGYLRLRHPLGWGPGEHAVAVVAHDRSGNRAQTAWTFSVPAPPAPPAAPEPAPASVAVGDGAVAPPVDPPVTSIEVPERVRVGGVRRTLRVRVVTDGSPASGVAVVATSAAGGRIAAAVTDGEGVVRLPLPRGTAGSLRITALEAEAVVRAVAAPRVELRSAARRVAAGASVRLSGSAPSGASVAIEARVRGRWVAVVRVEADRRGAFATPVRLPARGAYAVRARVGGAVSDSIRLTAD